MYDSGNSGRASNSETGKGEKRHMLEGLFYNLTLAFKIQESILKIPVNPRQFIKITLKMREFVDNDL